MGLETRVLMQPPDYGPNIDVPQVIKANMWQDLNQDTRMRQLTSVQEVYATMRIDTTDDYFSTTIDVHEASAVWIGLSVESTGAPTDVTFIPMLSFGGESDFMYEFLEGLWASMVFEDTDTAAGLARTYLLPCGGAYFLCFRVVGTGTNVANYFTVRIVAQPFRGNFASAHS